MDGEKTIPAEELISRVKDLFESYITLDKLAQWQAFSAEGFAWAAELLVEMETSLKEATFVEAEGENVEEKLARVLVNAFEWDLADLETLLSLAAEWENLRREKGVPITITPPPLPEQVCCICLAEKADTACVPCGHLCACGACLKTLSSAEDSRCPMCRTPVTGVLRIYA